MITIYGSDGTAKTQVPCDDNSTQAKELQGDNVLTLSFTLYEHIALEVNDYAEFMGERYWLMERYKPEQASTVEWKYDVKFYGIESLLKRFLVLNDTDGADEPVFTLTAPPREHVALIVKSINNGMDHTTDWKVGTVEGTENIVIDYEGKYCDEALKEVAEKAGNRAEWWVEGQTVNVCRCEHGEEVALGYGKGLTGISCDMADNAKFYTRLYPIGSSRNIDPEKYGHSRLQLPGGVKHVDVNVEKYGVWHHYEAAAFAGIYPRRTGTVSSVRSEEVTGENGSPFKIFYFTDDGLDFDPNRYEIAGRVKRVSFQEGSELAGLGAEEDGTYYFEANYNSDTHEFELITIWPYDDDMQLPNDTLCPKPGDKYILWNIRMPDEYYPLAEQEFREAVDRYNEQNAVDAGRYKAPTDHVYIEENGIDLFVGRRVRLESDRYFPETGFRTSRITKVIRKVNLPSQMEIEICDARAEGTLSRLAAQVEAARTEIRQATQSLPDIIRTGDQTQPTDQNLLSALRTRRDHLRRNVPDTATAPLRMAAGLTVEGGLAADSAELDEAEAGKLRATEATVDALAATRAEMAEASVGGGLSVGGAATFGGAAGSRDFAAGLAGGRGWRVGTDGAAEVDALTVRRFLEVPELRFNRVDVRLGDKWRAPGGGLIESVDTAARTCRLKLEEGELGAVRAGDICMGIYHSTVASENAAEDSDDSRMNRQIAGFTTVYFTVTEVTGERGDAFRYQLRPRSERWPREAEPRAMMTFVVYGSFTDTDRQTSVYETRTYTRMLRGQNTWETGPANIAMQTGDLSNLAVHGIRGMEGYSAYLNSVYFTGVIRQVDAEGEPVLTARDRGEWQAAEAPYDYYDRVSHGGRLWLCIAEEGTTDEPSEASAAWLLQVDSGGEGAAAVWVEVTSSAGVMFQGGVGRTELRATVRRAPSEDVTALVPSSRFSWERTGPDAEADALWNAAHRAVGPVIEVSGDDVARQATFQCLVALDGLAI